MWQSSDYLKQFNRSIQLAHNPRWANVREPTRDGVSMLMQHRNGELQEIKQVRAENAAMRASLEQSKADRKADSARYVKKLNGYSADMDYYHQQYSERVVSDGRAAASYSGDTRTVRSKLPDEASVDSDSDDDGQ
jgi:hypothetical protein